MIASPFRCDRAKLQQLLADQLTETVAAGVTQHVEDCEACRRDLELLAAEASWWQEARHFLADEDTGQTDDAAPGESSSSPHANETIEVPKELVAGFLSPADDSTVLGRLDDYDIVEIIGCGGTGIVLKGYDRQLNRHVAIKILAPHYATSAAARQRFEREAQAAAAVVIPMCWPFTESAAAVHCRIWSCLLSPDNRCRNGSMNTDRWASRTYCGSACSPPKGWRPLTPRAWFIAT